MPRRSSSSSCERFPDHRPSSIAAVQTCSRLSAGRAELWPQPRRAVPPVILAARVLPQIITGIRIALGRGVARRVAAGDDRGEQRPRLSHHRRA
jgi:hypothetical protein